MKQKKEQLLKGNIVCVCGATYGYHGKVLQGALMCFVCGRELVSTKIWRDRIVNEIKVALL